MVYGCLGVISFTASSGTMALDHLGRCSTAKEGGFQVSLEECSRSFILSGGRYIF